MVYRNFWSLVLCILRSFFIDDNFLIPSLEKTLDDTRACSPVKIKSIARENSIVSVDLCILGLRIILMAKRKFLRESHMIRSAMSTDTK
jgi:hypothetical protein